MRPEVGEVLFAAAVLALGLIWLVIAGWLAWTAQQTTPPCTHGCEQTRAVSGADGGGDETRGAHGAVGMAADGVSGAPLTARSDVAGPAASFLGEPEGVPFATAGPAADRQGAFRPFTNREIPA